MGGSGCWFVPGFFYPSAIIPLCPAKRCSMDNDNSLQEIIAAFPWLLDTSQ